MSKVYVHDGKEVILTGRKAKRKSRRRIVEVHEVKARGVTSDASEFCKWVKMSELYEIVEDDKEE